MGNFGSANRSIKCLILSSQVQQDIWSRSLYISFICSDWPVVFLFHVMAVMFFLRRCAASHVLFHIGAIPVMFLFNGLMQVMFLTSSLRCNASHVPFDCGVFPVVFLMSVMFISLWCSESRLVPLHYNAMPVMFLLTGVVPVMFLFTTCNASHVPLH